MLPGNCRQVGRATVELKRHSRDLSPSHPLSFPCHPLQSSVFERAPKRKRSARGQEVLCHSWKIRGRYLFQVKQAVLVLSFHLHLSLSVSTESLIHCNKPQHLLKLQTSWDHFVTVNKAFMLYFAFISFTFDYFLMSLHCLVCSYRRGFVCILYTPRHKGCSEGYPFIAHFGNALLVWYYLSVSPLCLWTRWTSSLLSKF